MSAAMTPPGTEAPLLPGRVENARALWVVLIIMALLAGCALLFARGAMRLSGDWQTQLGGTLTVQVLLENVDDWDACEEDRNESADHPILRADGAIGRGRAHKRQPTALRQDRIGTAKFHPPCARSGLFNRGDLIAHRIAGPPGPVLRGSNRHSHFAACRCARQNQTTEIVGEGTVPNF